MPQYRDYKEDEDKYVKDENGRYVSDIKDVHLNILLAVFSICVIIIPLAIVESIWLDYLPTGKIISTCIIIGLSTLFYLRIMLYEDKMDADDKFIYKAKHRKLK